jgi:hypothetical protein
MADTLMPHPLLYEINTRCWLNGLTRASGRHTTLADVPDSEFLAWQRFGFTHLWLMGVWSGGPRARAQALANPGLRRAYSEALPGWTEQDVAASPYAIAAYRVPESLGGNEGLVAFRQRLHACGLKLILDFVPNHLGLDHPWVTQQPDFFVQASAPCPETFAQDTPLGRKNLAHGKDPNWSGWTDTAQVDYRRPEARQAMAGLLAKIAALCDGVRCDMAMLVLNDVFQKTWKDFPVDQAAPLPEFWPEAIRSVRQTYPDFVFLAEVYWGLEARLRALGFDYTYDKILYDRLVSWQPGAVQEHLLELGTEGVAGGAHFLENHDEPRMAPLLPLPEHRAAALVILGLPGMRLLHEGQLQGWCKRLPVQLVRRAIESVDAKILETYELLSGAMRGSAVGQGAPELLLPRQAWSGNPTAQHFVLVQWTAPDHSSFDLVAVNLAPHPSQCYAPLHLPQPGPPSWAVGDLLGTQRFSRDSHDLHSRGLYLDLPAHGAQILHFIQNGQTP